MNNPLLKTALTKYPDVDAASLPWPADADTWELKDLDLFIGSGGFLKPKKKKADAKPVEASAKALAPEAKKSEPEVAKQGVPPPSTGAAPSRAEEAEEIPSSFEVPGFSRERSAITMPVRVHCEDTTPHGHVRLESLVAYSERIRSLALRQHMGVTLADLQEQKLAILATEFVIEIVGAGFRVLDTLRVDTRPEFPAAPLFPWETTMAAEGGSVYAQGRFGLNLCQISSAGAYSGVEEPKYREFAKAFQKWTNPSKSCFSATNLRFFNAYKAAGMPFRPSSHQEVVYTVRALDCDMYSVLYQARVPSMMQSCHPQYEATAMYVNIRMSVRPGEQLRVHVLAGEDEALFVCLRERTAVLTAFGHYGKIRPVRQEAVKCASVRIPLLLKFLNGEPVPPPNEDVDLSILPVLKPK
mmetsp:Transcript_3055/g.8252  ORF Transcript_3055/g.8252 Transcript_3055/m.8252 type:complete len:412 (-) Transcript_3055:297-1532(-)